MNLTLKRTDTNDNDFKNLVILLDADLAVRNGDLHAIYTPHNILDHLDTVIIAYNDDLPAGCGCFKKFDVHTVEIKRMFVKPEQRGKGIAFKVLAQLELWAKEKGYLHTVLETGQTNPEALGLYRKNGYKVIDNYGPYTGLKSSICLRKTL